MSVRRQSYRFDILWSHDAGTDPDRRYRELDVTATSVQRALAKVLGDLNEGGYDRKDIRILDVSNKDIT